MLSEELLKRAILNSEGVYPIGTVFEKRSEVTALEDNDKNSSNFFVISTLYIYVENEKVSVEYQFQNMGTRFNDYILNNEEIEAELEKGSFIERKDIKAHLYKVYFNDLYYHTPEEQLQTDDIYMIKEVTDLKEFTNRVCDNYHADDPEAPICFVQDKFELVDFAEVPIK